LEVVIFFYKTGHKRKHTSHTEMYVHVLNMNFHFKVNNLVVVEGIIMYRSMIWSLTGCSPE